MKIMKKSSYFEPDYYSLNRTARHSWIQVNNNQAGKFLNRLLPNGKNAEPIEYDPELFQELSAVIEEINQKVDWEQDLFRASYVAFDTETTGLFPFKGDEITSLGAVIIENKRILNQPVNRQLVNPRRPVSAVSQKITGISDEMLHDQEQIMPVILNFLRFSGPRILIAHNAPFDLAFINIKLGEAIGKRIVNPVIDTVLLTSALYYYLEDYSLENLSSRFDLNLKGRHDALSDARITASLFLKLLPELEAKGVRTLSELSRLFSDLDLTKGYPLIY